MGGKAGGKEGTRKKGGIKAEGGGRCGVRITTSCNKEVVRMKRQQGEPLEKNGRWVAMQRDVGDSPELKKYLC